MLTNTLDQGSVDSGSPGEFRGCRGTFIEVFSHLIIFDQFSPILREILHQKVWGSCLLKQVRVFSTIWYVKAIVDHLTFISNQVG